jgi:hypothetical protein
LPLLFLGLIIASDSICVWLHGIGAPAEMFFPVFRGVDLLSRPDAPHQGITLSTLWFRV